MNGKNEQAEDASGLYVPPDERPTRSFRDPRLRGVRRGGPAILAGLVLEGLAAVLSKSDPGMQSLALALAIVGFAAVICGIVRLWVK